jgi:hypothetical protein
VPLLDADLAPNPSNVRKARSLPLVVWLGIAAVGISIVLVFLVTPKRATETLGRVIEAAQALVNKDPPKPAAEQPEDDSNPLIFSKRRSRRPAAPELPAALTAKRTEQAAPGPAQALAPESTPLPHADVPLGATRGRVRELLGEPDLAVFKLEKENVVEHLVYVNQVQNYATTILLVGGRVVSVYGGIPSVIWKGGSLPDKTAASRTVVRR